MNSQQAIWQNSEFKLYLGSTAFSGIAFAMQQLLLSWTLIGILEVPASQVGLIQAAAGIPGIFVMLLGGVRADDTDPRTLLIRVYLFAPVLPLFLITVVQLQQLSIQAVLLWALGMSFCVSYSSPAQQTILNRIASSSVQKAVSAATAVGFLVQIFGLGIAGTIDKFGLSPALAFQAICVGLGAFAVRRLHPQPPVIQKTESPFKNLADGFREIYKQRDIMQTLIINFTSSVFNAGAFMTVFPFIVKEIYGGNAFLLSFLMVIFYAGATISNLLMIRVMPLVRPGRIFLIMQLSRMVILGLIWFEPVFWIFALACVGWGLNMGVTMTLARTIVQESATAEFRARIMSVYSLGLLGSAPIGALILGSLIDSLGILNALIPAISISIGLFMYGIIFTNVYNYRSPT
ncbi:MAG: MFS transporter [Pseudohongiellaceae bacterium]